MLTKEQWIEEAKKHIEDNKNTIIESENISSREVFWPRVVREIEYAQKEITFLNEGIRLLGE
jgi:hypothetical protein